MLGGNNGDGDVKGDEDNLKNDEDECETFPMFWGLHILHGYNKIGGGEGVINKIMRIILS